MTRSQVKVPSPATLKKYGLSVREWRHMLQLQKGRCFICERIPDSGVLCVDHLHVKNWRRMPPEKRKLYCRGLLCIHCNLRVLSKAATLPKLRKAVEYLERFENRPIFKEIN